MFRIFNVLYIYYMSVFKRIVLPKYALSNAGSHFVGNYFHILSSQTQTLIESHLMVLQIARSFNLLWLS